MFPLRIKILIDIADEAPPAVIMWIGWRDEQREHLRTQELSAVVNERNYVADAFVQRDNADDNDQPNGKWTACWVEIKMFVGTRRPFVPSCTRNQKQNEKVQ